MNEPKSMRVKTACYNCGITSLHEVPYHSEIIEFDKDNFETSPSKIKLPDERQRPFLCANCGFAKLEVIYWDSSKIGDPMLNVRMARS